MQLISPHTPTIECAIFRQAPCDFVVHEMMDIAFDGVGEHHWLFVQKTNLNTEFVAKLLAKWANIAPSGVGFSGLKDRRAIAYQWFSLHLPKRQAPTLPLETFLQQTLRDDEHLKILQSHWHTKKLNRGTHKANHFDIALHKVVGNHTAINAQLQHLSTHGVPNYFGEQRFGNDGNNLIQASEFFDKLLCTQAPYRPHKKDRHKHALYISCAKSAIFNALLTQRVQMNCWDRAMEGDVFNLDGTGSVFCADIDENIINRLKMGDIHPAGILYGKGKRLTTTKALNLENEVLAQFELFTQGLIKIDARLSHRPYRLMIDNLTWRWQDDTLRLSLTLPTGAFATSVLACLSQTLITKDS